jgi:hypothetical protein
MKWGKEEENRRRSESHLVMAGFEVSRRDERKIWK